MCDRKFDSWLLLISVNVSVLRNTEEILNFKGVDLVEITQDFGVIFFNQYLTFVLLLAVCADWLVVQDILFLTEIDYAVLNRQLRYWS